MSGERRQENRIERPEAGQLFLCATPIGNLEDMTPRAVRILREADLIAAEDTRNSIRLLNHFDIHTELTSYHEYNRYDKAAYLIERMRAGETVALITDAGMPGISDPGEELVRLSMEAGIEVRIAPGACACVSALAVSGLPTRRFCFEGFLPAKKKERRQVLEELERETRTILLYEAPHRLKSTLQELAGCLGDRRISLCRELTKLHETVLATTLEGACAYYEANEPRGEYVLVIEGRDAEASRREEERAWEELTPAAHLELYLAGGMDRREAIKAVAKDRGVSKREIYRLVMTGGPEASER